MRSFNYLPNLVKLAGEADKESNPPIIAPMALGTGLGLAGGLYHMRNHTLPGHLIQVGRALEDKSFVPSDKAILEAFKDVATQPGVDADALFGVNRLGNAYASASPEVKKQMLSMIDSDKTVQNRLLTTLKSDLKDMAGINAEQASRTGKSLPTLFRNLDIGTKAGIGLGLGLAGYGGYKTYKYFKNRNKPGHMPAVQKG